VPLELVQKDNLINRLRVTGPGDDPIPTLSQDATIAHSALAARTMVAAIHGGRLRDRYIDELEYDVIQFLSRNDVVSSGDQAFLSLANRIYGLSTRSRDRERLLIVVTYLQYLSTHYPLVVYLDTEQAKPGEELIAGQYIRLTISRRSIPIAGPGRSWWDQQRDRFRAVFGIRSAIVVWGLQPAMKARSYHLECMGPEGSYLARQAVQAHPRPGREEAAEELLASVNARLLHRLGQRFSHLYVHNFRPLSPPATAMSETDLTYVASFYERPPGTTASAAVSAFTAAVLITISATVRLHHVHVDNTDILAILLTLPAVASAWMGFGSGPSVFLGSLGARVALLSTMGCSLGGAAIFLLAPASTTTSHWWDQSAADQWIVLAAIAWLTCAGAGLSWILRVFTYRHFIDRLDQAARRLSK
jgi:hypothetical protein